MKIPVFVRLISSLFLLPAAATAGAGHYAGCAAGVLHIPFATAPLKEEGDQYTAVECHLQPQPVLNRQRWLPALPQLEWTQGLRTELSRSKGYAEFSDWRIGLPLYRISHMMIAVTTRRQQLQQLHSLREPATISGQTYQPNQALLLSARTAQWGIELDTRQSGSPLSSVELAHIQHWQPLSIRVLNDNQDTLTPAQFDYWQLSIKRQPLLPGWQVSWVFSLGHGQVYDDGNAGLLDNAALANDFINLGLMLGTTWRWRITPHLHWYNHLQGESQNVLFVSRRDDDNLRVENINRFSYRFLSGIDWRF